MSYGASWWGEPGVVADVLDEENIVSSVEKREEGQILPRVWPEYKEDESDKNRVLVLPDTEKVAQSGEDGWADEWEP